MINIVRVSKKPFYIIISKFEDNYFQYHLDNLKTKNKHCDVGCWNIKYKNK